MVLFLVRWEVVIVAKYKCGAIVKEVPKSSEKWYKLAGWKKLEEKKPKKEAENDKANSEKTATK